MAPIYECSEGSRVVYECELRFLAEAWGGFQSFGTRMWAVNVPPDSDNWKALLLGYVAENMGDFQKPLTDCWFTVERVTTRAWTDESTGESVTEERRLQVFHIDWAQAENEDVWREATDRENGLIQDDDLDGIEEGKDR